MNNSTNLIYFYFSLNYFILYIAPNFQTMTDKKKNKRGPKEKPVVNRKAAIQLYIPGTRLCELAGLPCTSMDDVKKAQRYISTLLLSRLEDSSFSLDLLKS